LIFKEAWHHNRCTSGEAHNVPAEEIGQLYEKAAENRVGSSALWGFGGVITFSYN